MDKKFSISEIENLGVYELRELARSLGVSSPTTKKIKQLKDEIKKIYSGEIKINMQSKRLGRPPKSLTRSKEEIAPYLIPKDIVDIISENSQNDSIEEINIKNLIFKHNSSDFFDNINQNDKLYSGYVRKTDSNHYYFWNQDSYYFSKELIVYIPDDLIQKFDIIVGDFVEVNGDFYSEKNCCLVSSIKSINKKEVNCDENKNKRVNLNQFCISSKVIDLIENETMLLGGRAIAIFENREQMAIDIIDYSKMLSKQGYEVIFVGCEVPPELIGYATINQDIKLFVSKFGDGLDSSYNTVANAINHSQALASEGKNVVVISYDIIGILDICKLYFESKNIHSSNGNQLAKTLFGLGRCFEQNSSISTVATLLKNEFNEDFVQKDLKKVASCIVGKY